MQDIQTHTIKFRVTDGINTAELSDINSYYMLVQAVSDRFGLAIGTFSLLSITESGDQLVENSQTFNDIINRHCLNPVTLRLIPRVCMEFPQENSDNNFGVNFIGEGTSENGSDSDNGGELMYICLC